MFGAAREVVRLTEDGFNRENAEGCIRALYAAIGAEEPRFLWFASPSDAFRVVTLWDLARLNEQPQKQGIQDGFRQKMLLRLLAPVALRVQKEPGFSDMVHDALRRPVESNSQFLVRTVHNLLSQEVNVHMDMGPWLQQLPVLHEELGCVQFAERLRKWKRDKLRLEFSRALDAEGRIMWLRPMASVLNNAMRPFNFCWGADDLDVLRVVRTFASGCAELEILDAIAAHCWWWRADERVCFMVEPPQRIDHDVAGRINGRVAFSDGFEVYALHGVHVTKRVAEGEFTTADIDNMVNVEVKRVMIENYGMARYLIDSSAEVIHSDEFGDLFRKVIFMDEPILVVRVTNSTPEPDETYRQYFLRVPPETMTAREGVAWSFGMSEKDYAPKVQT